MSGIFLKLLNLSISASWLVLVVLALRLVLKRAPKWVNVLLWGMVALRLMLPFSIESALSLIPSAETVSPEVVRFDPAPTITSGVTIIDNAVNPSLSESFAAAPLASVNPLYVWIYLAGWVWLIGLAAMLLYALVSYLRLRRRVSASIPLWENIYVCDEVPSPFILGIVRPRIYLPSALDEAQRGSVLSHERAHLARRDHWWKPLGFALLAVYWFNPLLWLAYTLLCRDIELACDERVLRGMDAGQVKAYSSALLACSVPRRMLAACPLAFGEVGVGARVKNALRYKKPAFWVVAASVAVCVVVAVCFLTNPRTDTDAAGLVGFHREQVTYADVTDASGAQPSNVQLTAEETDAVYALLDALQSKEKQYRTRFLIYRADRFWSLQVSDIAYFYSENKMTFAVTRNNQEHVLDLSLNKLSEQLDPDRFFRANRQIILCIDAIDHAEPYFNGKISVTVRPPYKSKITISEEKLAAFKRWLNF